MIRPEHSFERDLSYSQWHKTLSNSCYAMNLDWIEFRNIAGETKIVALIEDKDSRANVGAWIGGWKCRVFVKVAKALNVPAYLVLHNCCMQQSHRQLWKFEIINLIGPMKKTIMDEGEYRRFIENLGVQNENIYAKKQVGQAYTGKVCTA